MKTFYEIDGLKPKIEMEPTLKTMDCYEDSPVYEEVVDQYEELYDEMTALLKPVGIIGFTTMPKGIATKKYPEGTPIAYAVLSIGNGIKEESTKGFQEGDYVKGMLCDAMADAALFSMEDRMVEKLREACSERRMGILNRLEAPHDISMLSQKTAWDFLELKRRFGIDISSGYMFDPVKTSCQVFILTEDENVFKAEHDCRKCPNVNCKRRHIPDTTVLVKRGSEEKRVTLKTEESLMDGLIREGYHFSAACGGKGRCGKCRVQILEGSVPVTPEDEKFFSREELKNGWRLACLAHPKTDITVKFELNDESQFEILGDVASEPGEDQVKKESCYDLAIDIGTTTVVLELLGGDTGKKIHSESCINGQRVYGADVISRIKASMDGKKKELQESIRSDILAGIRKLCQETGVTSDKIRRVIIGGNTTMGHLLMGYDCDTLGVYPFEPVNIDFIREPFGKIFGECRDGFDGCKAEVTLLPGISTYVGGDIVSGLFSCDFDRSEDVCLLVDLGTNGEMALGNKDRILVTSTAAGPAFEGGNITWGMGSVPGAICSVKIDHEKASVRTIADEAPVGICGTGVVETVSELVKEEIVDGCGLFDEDYFEDGFSLAKTLDEKDIVFTQKDVREIQLAKAAVRAGVETLLLRYGVDKDQVKKVYLAGGFGYKLDTEKAMAIGMFPEEFKDRIEAIGNSSLSGAVRYLQDERSMERISRIVEISKEINLSADKDFNDFYMDSMLFGEE